ncbi:N-lysine methyltransferase KMT5A-like isoform X2 [Brevipalpus obovatus]|uniref:N-lysine methyltransferase KMT5A-like isoform X2 n=1 Tax=Brevipalpus obovatus TaxID=246614 RepID=UPI003D9F8C38
MTQQPITRYFQRTKRIPEAVKLEEARRKIHYHLENGDPEGFKVSNFLNKGKGVVTTKCFKRGDFICEYAGELLSYTDAKREKEHGKKDRGCYMYFFEYKGKKWCVDATEPDETLGRLINHSKKLANLKTKIVEHRGLPRLIFIATKDIKSGEELSYDYGDRRRSVVNSLNWLKS